MYRCASLAFTCGHVTMTIVKMYAVEVDYVLMSQVDQRIIDTVDDGIYTWESFRLL